MGRRLLDRRIVSVALLVQFAVVAAQAAGAEALVPLRPHPANIPWPTERWSQGRLPEGLDRAAFDLHVEALFAPRGRGGFQDTRALLVVQAGRLIYERYADGFGSDSLFQSWSMAKSITNFLVGVLVEQGRLDPTAPTGVPEWQALDDPRREITLAHLLEMRSGLDNADGFGSGNLMTAFITRMIFGEGSRAPGSYAANTQLVHPIGRHWDYSTGSSVLLSRICGQQIGGGAEGTRDFLERHLLTAIGMSSGQPEFAASGEFIGGVFFHARARDWARFGYLYLRDGVWDGRRILPDGWVDYTRTPNAAENNEVYGAHFWLNREPEEGQWRVLPGAPASTFAAEGASFQMVAIVPTMDLVAVRLGEIQPGSFPEVKEPFGALIAAFPEVEAR